MAPAAAEGSDTAAALPPGILPRLLLTWRAPSRVMRAQAALSDPSLLMVLMVAMALFFVAQLPVHNRAALIDPSIPVEARVGGALFAVLGLMPLLAYGAAWLVSALSWGRISGHASRVALFWSLMAITPAMLLCGLVEGYLGASTALRLLQLATFAVFLRFWIAGLNALRVRA